jgi:hypothetical protein
LKRHFCNSDRSASRAFALLLLFLVLSATEPLEAQKKILPPALLSARVAFLTGQPRINPLLPAAEAALRKWGRWEITFDSEVTDLILLITGKSDPDIFINPAAAELAKQYPPGSAVFLHVIDRANGTVVWTEPVKGKMTDAKLGTKLIENFQKRFPKK